jgi:hypothetical protein
MKTLVSFQALTAALAASLGLPGCGGETSTLKDGPASTGGGRAAEAGGRVATNETGGRASVGETGGTTSAGGELNVGGTVGSGGVPIAGAPGSGAPGLGGVAGVGGDSAFVKGGFSGMFSMAPSPCDPLTPSPPDLEPEGRIWCQIGGTHRPVPNECAVDPPRTEAACRWSGDVCEFDADCDEQPLGVCRTVGQGQDSCVCDYGCHTDADCEDGGVCLCLWGRAGTCVPATCRSDADCAPGFQCRGYQNPNSNVCDEERYECQTAADTCQETYYCTGIGEACIADSTGAHHCRPFTCENIGRPFWVEEQLRIASPSCRADWGGEARGELFDEGLTVDDLAALASYFTRSALFEHASVAAFARFALELLHFGAPLELVSGAQRAMGEEIEHARLCFALASRYGIEAVGPGALDVSGCLGDLSLEGAVRSAVREGCVGETVAAVQAAEAFEHARDGEVKAALERIRRDEMDHAELAFRFVRWALEIDPTLAGAVLDELSASAPAVRPETGVTDAERRRAEHGLLPEAHLAAIATRVHTEMVSPLLSDLVARTCEWAA